MNRSSPWASTLAALAGLGFAVLWFVALASVDPQRNRTDQELLTWWSDSGKRDALIFSMYSLLLAGPLFLVFLAQLCTRLRQAGPTAQGWTGLVFGAGIAFVALLAVTAFSRGVVAHAIRFEDEPIPGPDTLRFATAFSQAALGIAAIPLAALAIGAASAIIVRTGVLARWLGWFGLGVAGLSVVAVVAQAGALASPLFMLWVVATSFVIWRTRNAAAPVDMSQRTGTLASAPSAGG